MICYRDRTWCCSPVERHTCGREFTEDDRKKAIEWWGGEGFPLAVAEFCKHDKGEDNGEELNR